jgi:hypothetical protein
MADRPSRLPAHNAEPPNYETKPIWDDDKVTSLKQIEANRRNAQRSTGPTTLEGKERSRTNALRHGLTAETVIGVLESAEDYTAFERAIMTEYDPQSVIAGELVSRLASLLWRLRRATAIETGLFEMEADPLAGFRHALSAHVERDSDFTIPGDNDTVIGAAPRPKDRFSIKPVQIAGRERPNLPQCFLRLTAQSNFAFDRLSRYEASLWRQAEHIMFALGAL